MGSGNRISRTEEAEREVEHLRLMIAGVRDYAERLVKVAETGRAMSSDKVEAIGKKLLSIVEIPHRPT